VSYTTVLRNRGFLALWLSQVISRLGDSIHEIALIFLVFERTGDPVLVAVVAGASLVPSALVSLPAGTLVDRWNRKRVLVVSEFLRGVTVLAIPLVGDGPWLVPVVVAVAVVTGTVEAFFGPARTATIPRLVAESELDPANSLVQMTQSVSQMLYVFGGIVVAVVGATTAFYLDAASFLVSAGLLLGLPTEAGVPERDDDAADGSLRARLVPDIREGLAFVRDSPLLQSMMLLSVLAAFATGPLTVVLPFFVERELGITAGRTALRSTATTYGTLLGVFFLGSFVGSVVVGRASDRIADRRGPTITAGVVLMGLFLAATAVVPTRLPNAVVGASATLLCFGLAYAVVVVPHTTLFQLVVPNAKLGKISSITRLAALVSPPLGIALAGPLLEVVTPATLLFAEGLFLVGTGLLLTLTPLTDAESESAASAETSPG
jgi:MFS family permease